MWRLRQEDYEFEASLGNMAIPCFNNFLNVA
jgi:hypothetical protein